MLAAVPIAPMIGKSMALKCLAILFVRKYLHDAIQKIPDVPRNPVLGAGAAHSIQMGLRIIW